MSFRIDIKKNYWVEGEITNGMPAGCKGNAGGHLLF